MKYFRNKKTIKNLLRITWGQESVYKLFIRLITHCDAWNMTNTYTRICQKSLFLKIKLLHLNLS